MKLRLLGGQEEEFPYLVITDGVTEAKWQAQNAQAAWFKEPDSINHKNAYGWALLKWGRMARNKDAQAHAEKLLNETGSTVTK